MLNKPLLLEDEMLGKYKRIPLSQIKRKLYIPLKVCFPFSSFQKELNGFKQPKVLNTFGEDCRDHADLIRKIACFLYAISLFISQLEIIYYQRVTHFSFLCSTLALCSLALMLQFCNKLFEYGRGSLILCSSSLLWIRKIASHPTIQ